MVNQLLISLTLYIWMWLNLAEHLLWEQGVAGSNPVIQIDPVASVQKPTVSMGEQKLMA